MTKGKHIISCPYKPRTWFKKHGTTWVCDCGQWWKIDEFVGWYGDGFKQWVPIEDPRCK